MKRIRHHRSLMETNRTGYRYDPAYFEQVRVGDVRLKMEDKGALWAIYFMMKNRSITKGEIADELGLTKQRVHAMLLQGGNSHERIEKAIGLITDRRHAARHPDCPYGRSCGVYLAQGMDDLGAQKIANAFAEAKRANPEDWSLDA